MKNNIDEMLIGSSVETVYDRLLHEKTLEMIKSNKRKAKKARKIKKLVLIASLTTMASLGTISFVKACKFYNSPYYKLDNDLNIHNGTATVDGKTINPLYGHGCVIGGPEEGSISERFQRYCEENGITIEMQEKLIEKYPDLLEKSSIKKLGK